MRRRGFLQLSAAATALCAAPALCREARSAPLQTVRLTDRLFLVTGAGGNVVVFDSPDGVLMVDGGAPEHSADLLHSIREETGSARVHTLFNTHWHWEHTGSNRTLGAAGTRIIAHENTKLWLGVEVHCKWQGRRYPPLPTSARPNQTFYTNGSLEFGGERIDYGYLLQAHTDSDIYVFFRNANVLIAGDVLSVGAYPVLDYSTNGWIGGMSEAARTLADLCDENTRVIPGAGPVQSRSDLQAQHQMLKTLKERMSQLLAQGMSIEDMIAAAPTREFDAERGDPKLFIASAWHGLVPRARELGVSIV